MNRREFIKWSLAAAVMSTTKHITWASESKGSIPYRSLGRTGEKVSMIGLGGFHMGVQSDEQESIRIVRTALDSGVNFLDNCWDYNNGASEMRMGKALRDGYRDKAFLMSKIDGRTRKLAQEQIDESLRRLQTDHVDLMQLHEVIRINDPDRAFDEGGAIEALVESQKAGKTRYIGFTGHKRPEIHLHMLDVAKKNNFRFDTVQMPLNVMDAHFDSFEKRVLPELVKENIGVLGMKPMGSGIILESHAVTAPECLRYALGLPTSVVITGCDKMSVLDQALDVARHFKPMTGEETQVLLARTAGFAKNGLYEKYKTADHFDATQRHPEWLG